MLEFAVADMSCNHCVSSITKALTALSPDVSVETDLDTRRVKVGGPIDQAAIIAALDEIGFEATPVQA